MTPALGRDLLATPLSSVAQRPWNNLAFPVLEQKLELLYSLESLFFLWTLALGAPVSGLCSSPVLGSRGCRILLCLKNPASCFLCY